MSVKQSIASINEAIWSRKSGRLLLLHINILIFSFMGIFSKSAANVWKENGGVSLTFLMFLGLMLLTSGVYALFWQQSIKHFDIHVAYVHKTVSIIWSLLWALLFFSEKLTPGNVIGAALIIVGLGVLQRE